MDNTFKNAIKNNLENKVVNIGNCVVNLNSQGYLVNTTKWYKLEYNIILTELLKYIDSFDEDIERKVINLFNICN